MMRPKSITTFQILAWISVGLSALGLLIALVLGGLVVGSVAPRGSGVVFFLVMLLPIAFVGALALFTYLAANKRSNVGRWLYVAVGSLIVLMNLFSMLSGSSNAVGNIIVLLMTALMVASIVFLLTPESNAWFAGTSHYGHGGGYPPQHSGGYPPQHGGGYPPQQGGGYPPQQGGGYPPQQGAGYPPQQGGGYPAQQGGGYPPQQGGGGGYPPQSGGGYPPQ